MSMKDRDISTKLFLINDFERMITINQEKTLSKNKKVFLIISLLQMLITILPFAIVLLSIKSREWGQ